MALVTREEKLERFIGEFNELTVFFVRLFNIMDKKEKASHPATIFQCYTLRYLKDSKGMTMKQLSNIMGLATSTMTRNIDKMVKKDYLERVRGELDRREVLIRMTKKGRELTKKIQDAERYFSTKLVDEIPEDEWDNVLSSLNLLLKAFQKRREAYLAS